MASLARKTWLIWVIFAVVIAVMVLLASSPRTVTGAYRSGSLNWLAGENIYGEGITATSTSPRPGSCSCRLPSFRTNWVKFCGAPSGSPCSPRRSGGWHAFRASSRLPCSFW